MKEKFALAWVLLPRSGYLTNADIYVFNQQPIGMDTVTPKLLTHQRRYICLQSATYKAYNFNITEGTCTRFTSPCPQAFINPVMEFVVFRKQMLWMGGV